MEPENIQETPHMMIYEFNKDVAEADARRL